MSMQLEWTEMLQQSRTARQWYEDEKWLMDDEEEDTGEPAAASETHGVDTTYRPPPYTLIP